VGDVGKLVLKGVAVSVVCDPLVVEEHRRVLSELWYITGTLLVLQGTKRYIN
jgi:hypothetical protein